MLVNQCVNRKSTVTTPKAGEELLDLTEKTFNIPDDGIYVRRIKVDKFFDSRPDLVSQTVYDDPDFGDIICKFNGISNPFELNSEDIIDVPDRMDLNVCLTDEAWDDEIVTEEDEDVNPNNYNTLKTKTRKEKRAANEAVIGDKRFEVNYSRRIVVY